MGSRKAISPIIAIVIILLITIAIAGAGYSYISIYWTSTTGQNLAFVDAYPTGNEANLIVRNTGTQDITLGDVKILDSSGQEVIGTWTTPDGQPITQLEPGKLTKFSTTCTGFCEYRVSVGGGISMPISVETGPGPPAGLSIGFEPPTPPDGWSQSNNDILVNVFASGNTNISTFIDFDNSLVGWWRMDDVNASGDPTDYMNRNNGSKQGNAKQTDAGYLGKGFEFDGDGDYVDLGTLSLFNPASTDNFTIEAWIKVAGWADWARIIDRRGYGGLNGFMFALDNNQNLCLNWEDSSGANDTGRFGSTTSDISDGAWHHAVGTYNAGTFSLYVDGIPQTGFNAAWQNQTVYTAGGKAYAMAIGYGRNDSTKRLYIGSADGVVQELTWNGTDYENSTIFTAPDRVRSVVIGKGRNDSTNRVYATDYDNHVFELTWNGTVWENLTVNQGTDESEKMYHVDIGYGRNDSTNRVYTTSTDGNIYEYTWNGTGYDQVIITNFSAPTLFVEVGKGRNDSTYRLYTANNFAYDVVELTWNGTGWEKFTVGNIGNQIDIAVVGFGRDDSTYRVYTGDYNYNVIEYTWNGTGFDTLTVGALNDSIWPLIIGDARNDGTNRIYAGTNNGISNGAVVELTWNGTTFVNNTVYTHYSIVRSLAIGDIRASLQNRLYSGAYDGNVVEHTNAPNWTGGSSTWIGGRDTGAFDRQFNGTIDDVMIFNRSLSAGEITALYADQTTRYLSRNFTSLAVGDHTFRAYAQDLAGNVGETGERTVTII